MTHFPAASSFSEPAIRCWVILAAFFPFLTCLLPPPLQRKDCKDEICLYRCDDGWAKEGAFPTESQDIQVHWTHGHNDSPLVTSLVPVANGAWKELG